MNPGGVWLHEAVPYPVHLRSRAAALLPTASVLALNAAALLALGHWLVALADFSLMATSLAVYLLLRKSAQDHVPPRGYRERVDLPPGVAG